MATMNLAYLIGLSAAGFINDPPDGVAAVIAKALPEAKLSLVDAMPDDAYALGAGVAIVGERPAAVYAGRNYEGELVVGLGSRDPVLLEDAAGRVREAMQHLRMVGGVVSTGEHGTFSVLNLNGGDTERTADGEVYGVTFRYQIVWQFEAA